MTELDEVWSQMLAEAAEKARGQGRSDVADYLSLKASNDTLRTAAVKWLFDSIIEVAGTANRLGQSISIERTEPHNFQHRGANIVGSQLRLVLGVRCLTIEAGWTRTPTDGFMRGGALAVARLTHFGIKKENVELILVNPEGSPFWVQSAAKAEAKERVGITAGYLGRHIDVFLGR